MAEPAGAREAFAQALARLTGLDPRVIWGQAQLEGAYAPNGTGGFNFTNLRAKGNRGYSGVPEGRSPGGFAQFRNVQDAAKEAAYWLNTMPNYAGIRAAIPKGPLAQLKAISASPWDAGHYGGGNALVAAYQKAPNIGGGTVAAMPADTVAQPTGDPHAADTLRVQALQQLIGQVGSKTPDYTGFLGFLHDAKQAGPLKVEVDHGEAASPHAGHVVELAKQYLGTPYVWGGASPKGFDCSGFLQYLAGKQGVKIPRTTYAQWKAGQKVNLAHLQPGDAVFYRPGPNGPEHVKIYIGHGETIAAPHTGDVVKIEKLQPGAMGARRYV